jgi:hypothetical protein
MVCFGAVVQAQQSSSPSVSENTSSASYALRIKLYIGEIRDVTCDANVQSAMVVDPGSVKATVFSDRVVRLTGLDFGETIVIVSTEKSRETLMVQVIGHPIAAPSTSVNNSSAKTNRFQTPTSGLYSIFFSPPQRGARAYVNQNLQYRQAMGNDRVLHLESDLFKFLGKQTDLFLPQTAIGFGVNRLVLGVTNAQGALEMLDSELNLSPLSLNGYTIRGFHLTSNNSSVLKGAEFFAGLARPSISLLDSGGGRVMGGMYPLKSTKHLSIRAGAVMVTPSSQLQATSGGFGSLVAAEYTPSEDTSAGGEVAYGNSGVSWRGRLSIHRGPLYFSSEASQLDSQSPFISVGGQGGGRSTLAAALRWQASDQLSTFASYNQTKGAQTFNLSRLAFSGSTLTGGLSYRAGKRTQFGLRYSQQRINSTSPFALASQLETKTLIGTSSSNFAHNWSNSLEVRYNNSREPVAGAEMGRGFGLRDEVRHTAEWWSASAYFSYQNSAVSLYSLVLRNPTLLPPLVRQAFEADPQRFLATNRNLLQQILGDIELPQTRSSEVGVRFQAKLSRYSATAEVRLDDSKLGVHSQQNIVSAISLAMRLDSVNSIGVSTNVQRALKGSGLYGSQDGFSAITFSYTRQLGGPAEKGFLMKLLGRDHGTVKGRVFADSNANGKDDPGESGIAGIKVQLDDGHSVETEQNGNFRFDRVKLGSVTVRLASDDLGTRLRASTAGQQEITLAARQTANVSFGVVDFGFVAGRVFNELQATNTGDATNKPGINGVRLKLIPHGQTTPSMTRVTDYGGIYEFRNISPGKYSIEVDAETLPAYFRMPAQTSWELTVQPVRGSYLDIPLFAQRRVAGVVFIDKNGDGKLDPAIDEVVPNATVTAGQTKVVTGPDGAYLLRGLPAGKIEIVATDPAGKKSAPFTIELTPEPLIKSAVNLAIPH